MISDKRVVTLQTEKRKGKQLNYDILLVTMGEDEGADFKYLTFFDTDDKLILYELVKKE